MEPSARTTVKLKTNPSLIVPYLATFVPKQPVAIMPSIVAPGAGSIGKKRPSGSRVLFKLVHSTPSWTVTSSWAGRTFSVASTLAMLSTSYIVPRAASRNTTYLNCVRHKLEVQAYTTVWCTGISENRSAKRTIPGGGTAHLSTPVPPL